MGERLQQRLKQHTFASVYQEALLNILVTADHLQRQMEETCSRHGITPAQYNVLRILRGVYPEGHARCDIIERMIQAAPDVTRLIDRLERAGLAHRGKSSNDGRLSLTFITPTGLDLLDRIQPDMDALHSTLFHVMTPDDARRLSDLCEQLYGTEPSDAPATTTPSP